MSEKRPLRSLSESSSDSSFTEKEIEDVNKWLDKTPPKVALTLERLTRSKSFDKFNTKLKAMSSPFKETDKPQLPSAPVEETVKTEDPKEGAPADSEVKEEPTQSDSKTEVNSGGDKKENDIEETQQVVEQTDGRGTGDVAMESDEETEEEAKLEIYIEERIAELPQEDRPEVTLVFDSKGRAPTHDDEKIHVIPPNNGHEGQQKNVYYGKPPFSKNMRVWFGWPHSDPGKPIQFGFISCDKPYEIAEIPEPLYTLEFGSSWHDESTRAYYEKCMFPQSRLFFYHEKNRMAVARGRTRVNNPKNWDGLPNLKELPRGTVFVRNGMCFKVLSHIEHCSGVFAQLCHENGTVIGGPADADILHYDSDFKAPSGDAKARMLESIKEAEVQRTKTAAVLGKVLRAEAQKRKHRKPYKRETFSSSAQSSTKTEASHQTNFLIPEALVAKERKEAMFGGRHDASSVGSSQESIGKRSESSVRPSEVVMKAHTLLEKKQQTLQFENEALRKECDDLKLAFGQMMSNFQEMQKEKEHQLTEEAQLTRQQAHEKNFPLEAALLEHYKEQKMLADKEKASLQRQRDELDKALEIKRQHVVELKSKMKTELEKVKSRASGDAESSSTLQSIARDEGLKGAAREMFENRAQMTKLEEMLRTATHRCIQAGIELPPEVMEIVQEPKDQLESTETHSRRAVTFADEQPLSADTKDESSKEAEINDIVVDEDAKKAEAEMLDDEKTHSAAETHSPQSRTGISVTLGEDGYYYDSAQNAFLSDDVLKVKPGLNIVTHPIKDKIVSTVQLVASKKDQRISSAIESVIGTSGREEARRSLFKDDDLETYDIEHFRTASPDSEQHCTLFPSPIDSGDEVNLTLEQFTSQNRCNDRLEKSHKLEAMSKAKHEEKLAHVRRVAEAEIAALNGARAMELALKASRSRPKTPPFAISNIPDEDVQALRDLDAELIAERSKLREQERKAEEAKKLEKEKKTEERRRKKEQKEKVKAEAEARRAREEEEELRRVQQEEHDRKQKKRKDKEERRRQREYEASGDPAVERLQREAEFAERERVRKAGLERDAELAAARAKYHKLLSEEQAKASAETRKRKHEDSSDDDIKKKAKKESKPLPLEIDRLLQAKRSELQSLKDKGKEKASGVSGRATPEPTGVKHRFRGTCIPESGYVAQNMQPPFEVARRPGKVETQTSFLYSNESGWRWNWPMFNLVPLKVVQRKSLETNQVNINEFQAMQLAAGFVTMNMSRFDNFATKEQAYQELRQAIEAIAAMADGNMRQVRAAIHNHDLRDAVIQAAIMTNVQNGADYRLVALKQLTHIRNAVTNKFHYETKRKATGGAAGGAEEPGGGAPSTQSSESGD